MSTELQNRLYLQCFAAPTLTIGAASASPTPVFSLGKPLALLTYLACAPGRAATREQLIDLLWADTERDAARHTLRQTLWYLRRRLGADPLTTSGDAIALTAACVSDRDTFLTALDAGDHLAAVETYTGDFFPGFAAPGGAEFEQWADVERTRLRALFVRAAESLVRQRIDAWQAREAVQIARRARELAPLAQAARRLLLEALLAADDRIAALVEADQLEQWLARDEIPVEQATATLLRQVRREPSASAATSGPTDTIAATTSDSLVAELVGREREFSVLLGAWADARRGRATHVHIVARAGLGKTRLLEGLAKRLRSTRARVVSVRAPQVNRELPFALAADLTLALARLRGAAGVSPDSASALVALAPGVSTYLSAQPDRTTGDDALRRRTLALNELVSTIADDAPIAILVDDLHWADNTSRAMLSSLSATLTGASVLLVTASRQLDARATKRESMQQLALEPLSEDEVGTLVGSLGELPIGTQPPHAWADTLATRLHRASGGFPLHVLETLQLAIERGALALQQRRWSCPNEAALDQSLTGGSAIRERLLAVSEANQSTLLLLAVLGTELDAESVERAVGADGVTALHELELRGLLTHDESGWRIAHDEIADLAQELATDSRLARAHRQAATVLESLREQSANTLLRAAHHRRSAGDTRAVEQLFAQVARVTESTGDPRALRALAGDVLGEQSTRGERDALVHSLPWRLRSDLRRSFTPLVGSLTLVLIASTLLYGSRGSPPTPSAIVWATYVSGADTSLLRIPIDESAWRGTRDIKASRVAISARARARLLQMRGLMAKWGDTVVGTTIGDDTISAIDLVQLDLRTGNMIQLTNAPGDDYGFSRSPDGRFAVFTSARADSVFEHTDLFLLDRNTLAQTPLTQTPHWDVSPVWSHDGSRIAFIRHYAEKAPNALCVVTFDASITMCNAPSADVELLTIAGWEDDGQVLVRGEQRDLAVPRFVRIAVHSGQTTYLDTPNTPFLISPDARFAALAPDSRSANVLRIIDVSRPGVIARVGLPGNQDINVALPLVWEEPSLAALGLDRISIRQEDPDIGIDSRTLLRVEGFTSAQQPRSVPYVQWSVLDTAIATISARGELRPRAPGVVRVIASAGGWRADTVEFRISPQRAWTRTFQEQWETIDTTRWLAYGTPRPVHDQSTGKGAVNPNGDGHLSSGLFQRNAQIARTGAGVEVRVRAPLTLAQWQWVSISLAQVTDDASLRTWSGRDRPDFPVEWAGYDAHGCSLRVPRGEGGERMEQIAFTIGTASEEIKRVDPPLTDGAWHVIRLQVFADGRCGLAIDGRVIAVSENTLSLNRPMRLHLEGQSVNTRMLIGALEMWQGERHDLPWFSADSTQTAARARW